MSNVNPDALSLYHLGDGANSVIRAQLRIIKAEIEALQGGAAPVIGVTDGSNAAAGMVGELLTANVLSGNSLSLTNQTATTIASISLPAGHWDVWGSVAFNNITATTFASAQGWISTIQPPTFPSGTPNNGAWFNHSLSAGNVQNSSTFPCGAIRINVSATTPVYLAAWVNFSAGAVSAFGTLQARRRR